MRKKEPGPPTIILSVILGAILLWVLAWGSGVSTSEKSTLTDVDTLTVVLASLGLMVAILTFFLGVVAFFGWSAFRTLFEERFEESVRKNFDPVNKDYADLLQRFLEDAKTLKETTQSDAPDFSEQDEKLDKEI